MVPLAEPRKRALRRELAAIVGAGGVLSDPDELLVYESDGLTLFRALADFVVFPTSAEQVSAVVKLANREELPFVARGAGTGLSGGCLPAEGGIVLSLMRMNRVLEVDYENRVACVEPGVINLNLTKACAQRGLHYAPDPSSQGSCTIGGNVAENSGGPHTLKYGVTVNHVLGLEVVLPNGETVTLGGPLGALGKLPGYDLVGLFVGSEGTFGIATKVWVKLTPVPETVKTLLAIFPSIEAASRGVSRIVAHGIVPAALELIDKTIIRAVEEWLHLGFPLDAGAVLLIELDGLRDGLDLIAGRVMECCRECGCLDVRAAKDEKERLLLWKARKQAFGAVGRISPSYYVQDGVIPRSKLPEVLAKIEASGRKHGLTTANVFHAGDGNLHPLILFDERKPEQIEEALACNEEVLCAVIEAGGMLSGEHGIGIEKLAFMPRVFSEDDMDAMRKVRAVFDPQTLSNPGKAVPARKCFEVRGHEPPALRPPMRKA
ncbi:MAG: FAD-binding protein [Candidatus Rokubacteria bacterium]|nr:FAD-binding protein [Candidatus Rokubacteria bacterium]